MQTTCGNGVNVSRRCLSGSVLSLYPDGIEFALKFGY